MISQFGNKITGFFNNPARGANQGRNDHGIEIEFVLVSTELDFFDSSVESARRNEGFDVGSLDSAPNRTDDQRVGFGYYWGEPPPSSMFSVPFAERRRIVVINGLDNADGLAVREVLYNNLPNDLPNSGIIDSTQEPLIKAAINSVQPGVTLPDNDGDGDPDASDPDDDNDGLLDTDEAVLGLDPFLEDTDGNGTLDGDENGDGDHYTNAEELNLLLTDPLDGNSRFEPGFQISGPEFTTSIPTLAGRRYIVECSSDLVTFSEVASRLGSDSVEVIPLGPPSGTQFYRVRVEFAP